MEAMQPQEEPGCVASVRDALTGVRPEGYAGGSFKVNDLREVAKRRDSGLKGSTVPALMAKLSQWVVDKRLPELAQSGALLDFQFFEAAYYRNYPEFITVCEDLGLELGRPEWAQHKQDLAERTLLFDAVWAVQWENLLSDLADLPEREGEAPRVLQTVEKSHPQGWGGELNEVGQWRNTAGTYISGGQLAQIPEQSRELFGRVLFRMSTVSGGAEGPGWGVSKKESSR
jgi:hypothetical protein